VKLETVMVILHSINLLGGMKHINTRRYVKFNMQYMSLMAAIVTVGAKELSCINIRQ
jgi:hypothetical protein